MTEEATQDEKPIRSGESSQPGDSIEAGETPARKKSRLASALAAGMRVEDWARENSVARSTAYRWAADPDVKAEIREWRRRAIHETIGLFTSNAAWAVAGIKLLAEKASSEKVQLAAYRSIVLDVIKVTGFSDVYDRMKELEDELRKQQAATDEDEPC